MILSQLVKSIYWALIVTIFGGCYTIASGQEFRTLINVPLQKAKAMAGNKRVAILVGNNAYRSPLSPLANPSYDVHDLADSLGKLGFKTCIFPELDTNGFRQLIENLPALYQGCDVGLFYYAGHGVSAYGKHYLAPIDATADVSTFITLSSIVAVLNQLRFGITLIDACRNDPFGSNTQVENLQQIVKNGMLVYATHPGHASSDNPNGRNSLFMDEFLQHLCLKNMPFDQIIGRTIRGVSTRSDTSQIPEVFNKLKVDLVFSKLLNLQDTTALGLFLRGESFFALQKYQSAISFYKEAYGRGMAAGAFRLGEFYEKGYARQDYLQAINWYEKAAYLEDDRAQLRLGKWYLEGLYDYRQQKEVISADTVKAPYWLKKSVLNNNPNAQCVLGLMYLKGYKIQQDEIRAGWCFGEAARQGYLEGQYLYGVAFENGFGVKKDVSEAISWFRIAARQGHIRAQESLIRLGKSF